jgi:hypothetical protein
MKKNRKIRSDGKKEETKPATDPLPFNLESGTGFIMRGLVWGILVALVLSGIAFLLSRLLP